jgi:hypothetical protein
MSEESTTPDTEAKLRRHIKAGNRSDFDAALAIFSEGHVWDRSPVGEELIEGRDAGPARRLGAATPMDAEPGATRSSMRRRDIPFTRPQR